MITLRPPTRPPSPSGIRYNSQWFLWAVGGVVLALVVLFTVVNKIMGGREGTPVEEMGAKTSPRESVEISPGFRYEILIPSQEAQKTKKDKGDDKDKGDKADAGKKKN